MTKATTILAKGEGYVTDDTLRKIMEKSNTTGYLAEMGFPKIPTGANIQQQQELYQRINHQRICAKITNIRRGDDGESIIADVEDYGPMGKSIKKRIDGGRVDSLTFSIRGLYRNGGREIVTFDLTGF